MKTLRSVTVVAVTDAGNYAHHLTGTELFCVSATHKHTHTRAHAQLDLPILDNWLLFKILFLFLDIFSRSSIKIQTISFSMISSCFVYFAAKKEHDAIYCGNTINIRHAHCLQQQQ